MKILQVIPRFNPSLGGGVDVVYNISKHLALRGHDITIATTNYQFDAEYAKTLEGNGVTVIPFKHLFNYCLFIPSPSMNEWSRTYFKNFDIVHLNGSRSYQNSVAMKFAIRNNIPIVMQAHGSLLKIVERKGIKWLYDQVWGKNLIKNTSAFIALSHSEANAHLKIGIPQEKIHVIPNGVDLTKFENLPPVGNFRKKYSIPTDRHVILYLGRLHKSKGIDLLIEAFAYLASQMDNVQLVLVGPDGGIKRDLMRKIAERNLNNHVLFTGHVSEWEKYSAFVDSDVFVTPRFYGFPITFAESCACGLPIVTTNGGEYLDWINGSVGYSTTYDTIELCKSMKKILTDPQLKKTFSDNCRKKVKDEFNWKMIAGNVEDLYQKTICNKGEGH